FRQIRNVMHPNAIIRVRIDKKALDDETTVADVSAPTVPLDTRKDSPPKPYDADGDITGTIEINLMSHMGKLLFLVVGTYGKEQDGKQTAFTQVDEVKFNYDINTAINDEVQTIESEITFITTDVDGRIVPNAEVTIIENKSLYTATDETSEDDGSVTFSNVPQGYYNITVNYTTSIELEEGVYNESEFYIGGSDNVKELMLNMSTIDFEIVDYGGYPLTYGYINVSDVKGGDALDILQLSNDGKATFRWKNLSSYYYQVYYNNSDYSPNQITKLNQSGYIYRNNYAKFPYGAKHQNHTLDINGYNQALLSSQFNVKERIYTNDSTSQMSDIKLINTTISIQNNEPLTNVSVYYIDSSNNTNTLSHRIFFDDSYAGVTDANITIDLMTVVNSKLSSENRLAYGLFIDVWGVNTTKCTGNIQINMTEAWHVFNKTGISKLNIRVLGDGATLSDAIVTIKSNETIVELGGYVNTTLISDKSRNSFAFSEINDLPFMYLVGYEYNFSVVWGEPPNDKDMFNVSLQPNDQWKPPGEVILYNYTLKAYNANLTFDINMGGENQSAYKLKFDDLTSPGSVVWQNNISVQIHFNKTTDDWDSWSHVTNPDSIQLKIKRGTEVLFTFIMDHIGSGYYIYEFNSTILSAGIAGVYYTLVITGSRSPYILEGDELTTLYVTGKETVLSLHDYNSLNVITSVSQNYGELVNITVKYYNNSKSPLKGASITYEWLGLDPIQIYEDPVKDGYYTATINTSIAEVWGSRSIEIVARLENYTAQTLLFSLSITERPTSLNSETDLVYISSKVWVEDPNPFEFVFKDTLTGDNIGNLTTASYTWEELYPNGSRIPGVSGTGFLTQIGDNKHRLDFRTELRSIGFYYLYVTLHKQNYKARSALINLEIMLRIFNYTFPSEVIVDDILNVRNGDPIELDLILHDMSRDIPLENATISMVYQNENYTFSEVVNGSYSLEITDYTRLTENETSSILTPEIIISKANFTTQIIDITIILNNRIFNLSISKPYKDNLITIVSGDKLYFDITLSDSYDDSTITDGSISLFIGGEVFEDLSIINNGDGTYTITFLSYPEAFTSSKTLSGEIIIKKADFKTVRIPITIEIKMTEIFPGMPTFYFIILVVSIIGVLGSIVAYRVIQQARIPKHVKKIRKIKGIIKAKKKITDIISVPSKAEMLAKLFGNDWKQIDLSIEKSLGIEELKKQQPMKQPPIKDKIKEQRGDIE
ncbi:MAG: carboxypeptidase-like regulatory domain-containing protein, partial [Candidatus Odinarchaeota archaeon]